LAGRFLGPDWEPDAELPKSRCHFGSSAESAQNCRGHPLDVGEKVGRRYRQRSSGGEQAPLLPAQKGKWPERRCALLVPDPYLTPFPDLGWYVEFARLAVQNGTSDLLNLLRMNRTINGSNNDN